MEVSHATTENQSAAVGVNGKAEEVTVSTDAEFMMTIAHGIYSNKALALIRELLCNARDGHAKAGHLDKPIIVTLTENLLVVRDHGTGIPNAIFAKTYMTFGKSTKRQDKKATGGFGVGTKVPWAVCDVFSARNFIDGLMTAYTIIKSDPTMDGKPTCTPVVSVPSTEPSGVEVSVPFPEKMFGDINKYLLYFADELSIPLVVNGTLHEPRGEFGYANLEMAEYGFVRLPRHPKTTIQPSPFYVRQGDVLYPIEMQDEFEDAYTLLEHLNTGNGGNPIAFLAEPDSIIPTLSRESLQYTDRTSGSIRELMKGALKVLADNVDAYSERTAEFFPTILRNGSTFISEMWENRFEPATHLQYAHREKLKDNKLSDTQNHMLMNNMMRWLNARTPYLETPKVTGKAFREDLLATLKTAFLDKLKTYSYYDHAKLVQVWEEKSRGWSKNPTYVKLLGQNVYEEIMFWRAEQQYNPDVVEVYFPRDDNFRYAANGNRTPTYFVALSELKDVDVKKEKLLINQEFLRETMYVSNTVVISTTPSTMIQRANQFLNGKPGYRNVFCSAGPGQLAGARCVRVKATLKPNEVDKLKAFYESWGYSVITLMEPTTDEREERQRLADERAALKAIPLPRLEELIRDNIPVHPLKEAKLKRRTLKGLLANPQYKGEPFYFILPRGKDLPYNMKTLEDYVRLVRFVGTDIQAVSTKPEILRVIKEGRKNLEDSLLEIAKWFYTQPGMHEKLFYRGTFFVTRANQNKYLTRYLFNRVPLQMTPEDTRIYEGLKALAGLFPTLSTYLRQRNEYYASACTPEAHYNAVFSKYAQDNFCDVHRALDAAYSTRPSRKRALARSILKTILKERPA
jgi:hypothetical protein